MKKLFLILALMGLTGCSTIDTVKEYWPRAHDPVMFNNLLRIEWDIVHVDCEKSDWKLEWQVPAKEAAILAKYTEYRGDPQRKNIKGLADHTDKMGKGGSKMFCQLGKKTAQGRIDAARKAWEGR